VSGTKNQQKISKLEGILSSLENEERYRIGNLDVGLMKVSFNT
jgi:hypothetical protein